MVNIRSRIKAWLRAGLPFGIIWASAIFSSQPLFLFKRNNARRVKDLLEFMHALGGLPNLNYGP